MAWHCEGIGDLPPVLCLHERLCACCVVPVCPVCTSALPPAGDRGGEVEAIKRGLMRDKQLNVHVLEMIGEGSFGKVYRGGGRGSSEGARSRMSGTYGRSHNSRCVSMRGRRWLSRAVVNLTRCTPEQWLMRGESMAICACVLYLPGYLAGVRDACVTLCRVPLPASAEDRTTAA